jgi:hypothetical protein
MTIATYETGALASETNSERLLALEATPELAQSLYESSKDMMTERGKQAFEEQIKNVIERRHND